jgi:hypothetical protein
MNLKTLSLIILVVSLCLAKVSTSDARFVDNGNNTITDTSRKLMWQKASGSQQTWQSAIDYCNELVWAGFDDWRLPHLKELYSILEPTLSPPYDITMFQTTDLTGVCYWTSTTRADNTTEAWYMDHNSGYSGYTLKETTYGHAAWCVRSGN